MPSTNNVYLPFPSRAKYQEYELSKKQPILEQLSARRQKQTENIASFISTPLSLYTIGTKFAHMLYYQMCE